MAKRKLEVVIAGDASSLHRSLGRAGAATSRFGKVANGAKRGILAVGKASIVAGGGAAILGGKIISLASDAEETASKFKIVFGGAAKDATRALDTFSKATGTSKFALRAQAAQFQALIRPMGLTTERASDMSVGMTKLATDLASFNNTSVDEAILALQSGLVGEAEPLRRYSVQLSAARVEAFAYANGIAKTGEELTTAQLAQARWGIILEDTKLAQGDATKTAGSFANQFKRLKSTIKDVATELGIKLLPLATKATAAITKFINEFQAGEGLGGRVRDHLVNAFDAIKNAVVAVAPSVARAFGIVKAVVIGAVAGVRGFVAALKDNRTWALALVGAVGGLAAAFVGLKVIAVTTVALAAMGKALAVVRIALLAMRAPMVAIGLLAAMNPFVLIAIGLVALGAALVVAYKKSETFRNIVNGVFNALKVAVPAALNVIKNVAVTAFNAIKSVVQKVFPVIAAVVRTYWSIIATVFRTYFNIYKAIVTTVFNVIKAYITTAFSVIKAVVTTGASAIKTAFSGIKAAVGIVTGAFNLIKSVVRAVISTAVSVFDKFLGVMQSVLSVAGRLPGPLGAPFRAAESAIKAARSKLQAFQTTLDATESRAAGVRAVAQAFNAIQTGAGNAQAAVNRLFALIDAGVIDRFRKLQDVKAKAGANNSPGQQFIDRVGSAVEGRQFQLGPREDVLNAALETVQRKIEQARENHRKTDKKFKKLRAEIRATLRNLTSIRDEITRELGRTQRARSRRDAFTSITDQLSGIVSEAGAKFRSGQEKEIDDGLRARLALINQDSPEAQELRALIDQREADRIRREDANLEAQLAEAKASGNVTAITEAEQAIADVRRDRRIDELGLWITNEEAKANAAADKQRAGLDQQQADYEAALGAQLKSLTDHLQNGVIPTYRDFANQVQAILGPLGLSFAPSEDQEAGVEGAPQAPSTPRVPRPRRRRRRRRALGGPVSARLAYTVGERGEETFVPNTSGRILPNGAAGSGMGAYVHIENYHANGGRDAERLAHKLAFRIATASG